MFGFLMMTVKYLKNLVMEIKEPAGWSTVSVKIIIPHQDVFYSLKANVNPITNHR